MKAPIKRRRWGKSELTLVDSAEPRDLFARAKRAFENLDSKGLSHSPSCVCPVCLYELYEASRKGPGRPWSKNLFLVAWLIHEARLEGLIKKGLVEELNSYVGIRLFIYRAKDYARTPAWKTVTQILNLYGEDLLDLLPAYSQRIKSEAFRKVLGAVMDEKLAILRAEHNRLGPPWPGWEPSEGLKLAIKIRDFVLGRPGKKATRREIQRKFNVSGAEVDRASEWLEGFTIYLQQIAHKLQRKRGGYRNKQTVIYAVEKPAPRRPDRKEF